MSSSHSQVGYLVPLNQNLEEAASAPKLAVSDGTNVIGRNNLSVSDKRLSRKHLTITASTDGTANLHVEGTNPIVVNSGNKRRKLNSKETATISDGDIIELIPGHHVFKYQVLLRGGEKGSSSGVHNAHDGIETHSVKRGRNAVAQKAGHCDEAIRDFHVADDQMPCTFRLLRVKELPPWANTSCVSISDVIQGDILVAILSNYMVDIDWLIPACPTLSKVPHVLVIHGESDERVDYMKRNKPANWILHKPPLPISFGTHHSKAMLLVYPRGVRIIVHTANLIYVDWNNKSQGLWMQDFPWKDQNSLTKGSGFENDLVEYLSMLKWPEFSVKLPSLGNFSICPSFFKKFDYSDAMVRLIASVPGYHSGPSLKKWGHMKLRSVLQECTFDEEFKKSPLVYQFSSLGSLDEKWMAELASSMSAGLSEDRVPLGMGEAQIIWPTVEDVRCSLEAAAVKDAPISVSCVTWSPDGSFVGVAFTKHLIHLYAYTGSNELAQRIEVDAHVGGVNDLAFAHPNKQLCIVTCGDDKLIKVWDANGRRLFTFEGHEAPVYSICPHHKENIQFIFSTAIDGKIKAWLYDNMGSRVDYDAPGHSCTTMLYSADGSRLFSCGTSKDGESFLVEWNESEGAIKRTYNGFRKKSAGVVQFDTTQNRFLAAGEDGQVKFWDMDNINLLTSIDADGGLQGLPRLRFNKEGNILAVTTVDNGFKILANATGIRSLRTIEAPAFEALRSPIESAAIKVSGSSTVNVTPVNCKVERSSPVRPSPILNGVDPMGRSVEKPRTVEDVIDRTKPWQLSEILDPVQCRSVTLPDSTDSFSKVVRLLYTNSGVGILALGSNGVQKLWKWARNEHNPTGKATASVVPQHWQPNSGLLMTNDISGVNLEAAVPCIALSKNDSYVMSACGGKISLFNMMTFKVMTTFMSPSPASTFLAFHPQDNNIIAIGMEDSTIHIYNVRVDEVKSKLKGHQKRITGLAFSTNLNILVSSGADAQLSVWSIDTWEKRKSIPIQLPAGKSPVGDTRVQFHSDQLRLLVVHETQLAIYDASKMDRIRQWVPQDVLPAPISYAAYSCNSQLIYATFCDANIGVFDADSLRLRCRIAPSICLSSAALSGSQAVHPLVVAAHPLEPNQFAVGLTDGSVRVIEPSESEGKWGSSPPMDNGILNGRAASSSTTSNHTADQAQR